MAIEFILEDVFPVFFLQMSILMNITKWINYFLFLRTQRKIRYEEVYVEMMHCKIEDDYYLPSNQLKLQNSRMNFLSQLERQNCITYRIIGTIAVGIISTYVIFTVIFFLSVNDDDKRNVIEAQIFWVNTIGLAFLTICPTVVNIVIIHRLRDRFDDLYADFGCKI